MMLSVLMLSALVAIANLTSCKSSASVAPIILKDSVSITYKQGQEQPASIDAQGAAIESRKNSSAPALGKVGLGATREASVFEGLLSQRTNKPAVPPTIVRVDTIFIERWHTQEVPSPPKPIPRFYKDCTKGFWILLILLLGSFGFRIMKAIYLRK